MGETGLIAATKYVHVHVCVCRGRGSVCGGCDCVGGCECNCVGEEGSVWVVQSLLLL